MFSSPVPSGITCSGFSEILLIIFIVKIYVENKTLVLSFMILEEIFVVMENVFKHMHGK